jgi:hypothetical protein
MYIQIKKNKNGRTNNWKKIQAQENQGGSNANETQNKVQRKASQWFLGILSSQTLLKVIESAFQKYKRHSGFWVYYHLRHY